MAADFSGKSSLLGNAFELVLLLTGLDILILWEGVEKRELASEVGLGVVLRNLIGDGLIIEAFLDFVGFETDSRSGGMEGPEEQCLLGSAGQGDGAFRFLAVVVCFILWAAARIAIRNRLARYEGPSCSLVSVPGNEREGKAVAMDLDGGLTGVQLFCLTRLAN